MKRIICIFSALILIMILSACRSELVSIDECEWKMSAVMSADTSTTQDENNWVIAVGEPDEIYPDAPIIDLKLTAKDGTLTLTDATNGKTYTGSYTVQKKTLKSIDYKITVDGISGYAAVTPTTYYDGSELPTLPISLGEYALYFVPNH